MKTDEDDVPGEESGCSDEEEEEEEDEDEDDEEFADGEDVEFQAGSEEVYHLKVCYYWPYHAKKSKVF